MTNSVTLLTSRTKKQEENSAKFRNSSEMPLTIQAASEGLALVRDYSQWPCLWVLSHMWKTTVWKCLLTAKSKEATLAVIHTAEKGEHGRLS